MGNSPSRGNITMLNKRYQSYGDLTKIDPKNITLYYATLNETEEAQFIVRQLKEIQKKWNLDWHHIAIGYRSILLAIEVEKELKKQGIPFSSYLDYLTQPMDFTVTDQLHMVPLKLVPKHQYRLLFIPGMEEGLCLHSTKIFNESDLKEEYRCIKEAIEDTADFVILSSSNRRMVGKDPLLLEPSTILSFIESDKLFSMVSHQLGHSHSPFLNKLSHLELRFLIDALSIENEKAGVSEPLKVKRGDKVKHHKWGTGTVKDVCKSKDDMIFNIEFGRNYKKLIAKYANLKKVDT